MFFHENKLWKIFLEYESKYLILNNYSMFFNDKINVSGVIQASSSCGEVEKRYSPSFRDPDQSTKSSVGKASSKRKRDDVLR